MSQNIALGRLIQKQLAECLGESEAYMTVRSQLHDCQAAEEVARVSVTATTPNHSPGPSSTALLSVKHRRSSIPDKTPAQAQPWFSSDNTQTVFQPPAFWLSYRPPNYTSLEAFVSFRHKYQFKHLSFDLKNKRIQEYLSLIIACIHLTTKSLSTGDSCRKHKMQLD